MKRLWSLVWSLILPVVIHAQTHKIAEVPEVGSSLKLMERWVEAQMQYRQLPGICIGIVYDQDLVYAKGFGFADVDDEIPVTPQIMFRIASITKTFTAMAIMQLRDQGKLQLDDPIEKHLKWFRIKNRYPNAPTVTVWHLLTHTSGLPREAAFPYWTDNKFPTRNEMIAAMAQQETLFPTETRMKYSNLAYALAGEIVAEVSGIPYADYVTRNILEPLGMNSTTVFFQDVHRRRLATGYGRRLEDGSRKEVDFTNAKGLAAAANMTSTVEDLAKFASLQFREGHVVFGSQILKGSTVKEMQRVQWLNPNWKSAWGIGFAVWRQEEKTVVGHSGWISGYRSQFSLLPDDKIALIVLTNGDDGDPGYFTERILSMMLPSLRRATATSIDIFIPDPSWIKYTGKYVDAWSFETDILLMNGKLMMYDYSYPPEGNPRGNLVDLTQEAPNTFRMIGENGDGELVIFEMSSDNKVTKVKVGENFLFPKK
ncbi:MAG: beta-lactamase family protein [Ignavibacteriales bacterium]|nr:beta-lactamase family protein [Ignavibacteriales bacterium]